MTNLRPTSAFFNKHPTLGDTRRTEAQPSASNVQTKAADNTNIRRQNAGVMQPAHINDATSSQKLQGVQFSPTEQPSWTHWGWSLSMCITTYMCAPLARRLNCEGIQHLKTLLQAQRFQYLLHQPGVDKS